MNLTIVTPAYNEKDNIVNAVHLIDTVLKSGSIDYEWIIVDDGSRDETNQVISNLKKTVREIKLVTHSHNQGIAAAFKTGIGSARGDWVILLPADLAMKPEDIMEFWNHREGTDIVLGIRSDRRDSKVWRRAVSILNIFLIKMLFRMKQRQFNYIALYRRSIFNVIRISAKTIFFHAEILIKARDAGYDIRELDVEYAPRLSGKSSSGKLKVFNATFKEMMRFYWRWIRNRSNRQPLPFSKN